MKSEEIDEPTAAVAYDCFPCFRQKLLVCIDAVVVSNELVYIVTVLKLFFHVSVLYWVVLF